MIDEDAPPVAHPAAAQRARGIAADDGGEVTGLRFAPAGNGLLVLVEDRPLTQILLSDQIA